MKKKLIALLLVATTLASLTACGSEKEVASDKSESKEEAASNDDGSADVEEEVELTPIKFLAKRMIVTSIGDFDMSTIGDSPEESLWAQYQAKLAEIGLTMEVEAVENEQQETVISTRLASGKDLPDFIFMGGYTQSEIVQYGEDGVIVDILALLEQYDEDGSILACWNEWFPDFVACASTEDGKLYNMPTILNKKAFMDFDGDYTGNTNGLLIRGDWLDNLGIEYKPIYTTEEFMDIMKAFREQDANGNGVADEVIAVDPTLINNNNGFWHAFGFNKWVTHNADTGELSCVWYEKDATTAAITFLQDMIDAEYFDMAIVGSSDYKTTLISGNRAGVIRDMMTETWVEPSVSDPNCEYLPFVISTDYATAVMRNDKYADYTGGYSIPASCDHLEAVVKFMDNLFTYDSIIWQRYGDPGIFADVDETGYWAYLPEGEGDPEWNAHPEWNKGFNQLFEADAFLRPQIVTYKRKDYVEYSTSERKNEFLGMMFDRSIDIELLDGDLPMSAATADELATMAEIETDLTTRMEEVLAKMVLGQYDVADFDSYVEELKGLGLDDYYSHYEGRVARYKAAK